MTGEIQAFRWVAAGKMDKGRSLDELLRNLKQAVRLHLEGEDPGAFGLSASPRILMTYEENLSVAGEN